MSKIKLILKEIEEYRASLEQDIEQKENLSDAKIITKSQKLDSILNEYMEQINKNEDEGDDENIAG
ncbi:aspartyl-phosphate phosphatase Spo0E family protein [Clostridium sp. WILCCON 0269]|uniref:Aspartyl-phosphate phosphatase Spo0E family protein n=1 Tax=Candidatus Clostridium eludens TaxID=3381663 RepID=A0ABW8SLA7_9CLOT